MKLSSGKIVVMAVALMVAQLAIHLVFVYLRSYISNNFESWKDCTDFQACLKVEIEMFDSIYFYEIRALIMGLLTFVFCYFLLKKYKENILMNISGVVVLSLSWVPALWVHWGGLKSHTLDVIIFVILGGAVAYLLVEKFHITSPSI